MPRVRCPKDRADFVVSVKSGKGARYETSGQLDEDFVLELWGKAHEMMNKQRLRNEVVARG